MAHPSARSWSLCGGRDPPDGERHPSRRGAGFFEARHVGTSGLGFDAPACLTRINATAEVWRQFAVMSDRMLTIIAVAIVASCAPDQAKPPPRSPTSDEGICLSYGFAPGTTAYTTCVQREIDARRSGKLGPTYDQRLIAPQPAS